MRRTGKIAGLVCILVVLTVRSSAPAFAAPFYRETFSRAPELSGKEAGSVAGWKGQRTRHPFGKPTYLKVFPPGSEWQPEPLNSFAAGSEQAHAMWSRPANGGLVIYTDEISFDAARLQAVEYEQRLSGPAGATHLALLIGRTWYVSDVPALQKQRGIWEGVRFKLSGMTFGTTPHTPCLGPAVPENAGFYLPPDSSVTAVGIFLKKVTGRVRIDNFTLLSSENAPREERLPSGNDYCPTGSFMIPDYQLDGDETVRPCPEGDLSQDCIDDADQDGLTEREEWFYGTNPLRPDSDGDGRTDREEVDEGSNPLDSGSFLTDFGQKLCVPWNTFFGMWNVAEHVNGTAADLGVSQEVLRADGSAVERLGFALGPRTQLDTLVHETAARHAIVDSYGTACSSHDSGSGALRLALLQYRPEIEPEAGRQFQYALAMSAGPGIYGPQAVPFNTYSPGLAPQERRNLVANWITVVNQNDPSLRPQPEGGWLRLWNLDGTLLDSLRVELGPGERRDYAGGHQYGPDYAGLAEFVPDSPAARFTVANSRYVYRGPSFEGSNIAAAFLLPAAAPSGELLAVPLNDEDYGAVLELANIDSVAHGIEVMIYSSAGERLLHDIYYLKAKASVHIIADPILNKRSGFALVKGAALRSTIAVGMHYRRNSGGALRFMFGIQARQPLGTAHIMSYNSFLGQKSQLWGINTSADNKDILVAYQPWDGPLMQNKTSAAGRTLKAVKIEAAPDSYGTVAVASEPGTVWWSVRRHPDYAVILPSTQ